jgi:hypothetical protein
VQRSKADLKDIQIPIALLLHFMGWRHTRTDSQDQAQCRRASRLRYEAKYVPFHCDVHCSRLPLGTLRSAVKLRAYAGNGKLLGVPLFNLSLKFYASRCAAIQNSGIETIQAYRANARRAAAKYREKCSTLFPFSKNKPC